MGLRGRVHMLHFLKESKFSKVFIECLIFIGHFPPKSPVISCSFAENYLQLKTSYGSSPPCTHAAFSESTQVRTCSQRSAHYSKVSSLLNALHQIQIIIALANCLLRLCRIYYRNTVSKKINYRNTLTQI